MNKEKYSWLEGRLAMHFLLSRREGRFLSMATLVAILGLAFGVSALLVALSVVSGFEKEYKKSILGFNSHLIVLKADEIRDPEGLIQDLTRYEKFGKMVGVSPFIYREGMAVSGTKVKGIVLKGVDFEKYSRLSHLKIERTVSDPKLPQLILGKKLSEELQLKPSDSTLRVLFPQGLQPESMGTKNIRSFVVTGNFESGLYEYDSSFALLSLSQAKDFFETGGRVSGIEIWLEDPDRAEAWASAMRKEMSYPFEVTTWRELNENIFRALETEKFVFGLIMVVLIGVASLNILGTLMMLVLERQEEVSVLRTLGLTWKRVRKIFLFDGLLIGSAGIVLGLLLGGGVLFILEHWQPIHLESEIYFVSRVPVHFSFQTMGLVVGIALSIVFLGCELALRRMGHSRMGNQE
ncbi:MAG: ABC transporter permease [Deltaproteobacteria bacterium]|nr:ABC transporter permease [Deltaproteobacteria bacterium]